ncbi:MAG TPA: FlgD immunoglobulin-like domain containing protein, partial [Candidatus Cloacimonadota bacterium]|nr:FlgD immunoglobulin-like domain containing protein [Candidatus Cloacimonadota bacterium]
IRYNTAKAGLVNISVYNIRGQKVRELVNESKASGNHSISWDGNDAKGKAVASGVYYLRMVTGDKRDSKKITLIK